MSRPYKEPDTDGGWEDDRDDPLPQDVEDEDDEETVTVPCPSCRRPIAELSERCPYCGDWVVMGSGVAGRGRGWLIVAAVLALAGMIAWYVL